MASEVIGAVLAGGRGTRIGGPKAELELGGRPLISYPLDALGEAGIDAVVVAKSATPLPKLSVPIWYEPDEPVHPLCGIVTALREAGERPVVVCGCDMPFLTPPILRELASRRASLVVPRAGGRLHPLLARYEPVLLDRLQRALDRAEPLQQVVARLDPLLIEEDELRQLGNSERLLLNVNEPADLARAENLLRR